MTSVILNVPEISCEHCEHAITEALTPQEGVHSVRVDIPAKRVHLEFDESRINLQQVGAILEEEGYEVESSVPA